MVQSNLPVPGRPTTIWMIVGQRPIALAVGAGVFFFFFFFFFLHFYSPLSFLFSFLSLIFLSHSGRRPDID